MKGLNLPPGFVEREGELAELRKCVEDARDRKGCAVFIMGESGVGKTRIVEELISYAEQVGFKVHVGRCLQESLTPLMPIIEALRSAGLEHLITDDRPPRVECLYAVAKSGIILGKHERHEHMDTDILMGMVIAIENFVKDTLKQLQKNGTECTQETNTMGYGAFNIVNLPGKKANIVAITTGRENEFLIADMRATLGTIESFIGEDGNKICNFDIECARASAIGKALEGMLALGRYEGGDYSALDPKVKQSSLFENVVRGLQRRSEVSPQMLFIDDIQWADPSTLALMHYISRNVRNDRVVVVATCRQEDLVLKNGGTVHRVVEVMQNMNRESLLKTIELKRFDEEGCRKLIASVLGSKPDNALVSRLYSETEGNALFVIELLKNLYEDGYLSSEGGISTEKLQEMRLPSRVYDAIARRLQKLSREERDIIESASIVGDEFTSSLVATITGTNRLQVLRSLGSIERVHKLIRTSNDRYRFEHSKIREVLCAEMNAELKKYYNEEIAKALEAERSGGGADVLPDIVAHYHAAGNLEKVVQYGLEAGKFARGRYANEEAIRLLDATLAAIDSRLGLSSSSEYDNAEACKKEIASLLDDKANVLDEMYEANETLGRYNAALEYLDKKHALVSAIASSEEERALEGGTFYRRKATIAIARGEHERALEHADAGLHAIEVYLAGSGKNECVGKLALERARLLSAKGFVYERSGDYAKALELQSLAQAIFLNERAAHDIARTYHRIGTVHHNYGALDEAEANLAKALKMMEEIGDIKGISGSSNNLGEVYRIRGERDKAMACYERAIKIDEKTGDRRGLSVVLSSMGDLNLETRDYALSAEYYEKSNEICRMIDNKYGLAWNYCGLSEALIGLGKLEEARAALSKAHEHYSEVKTKDVLGWAKRVEGMLYDASGEREKSKASFDESVAIFKEASMDVEEAKSAFEYAHRVLAYAGSPEREKARIAIGEVKKLFDEKGMKLWSARCGELLR